MSDTEISDIDQHDRADLAKAVELLENFDDDRMMWFEIRLALITAYSMGKRHGVDYALMPDAERRHINPYRTALPL